MVERIEKHKAPAAFSHATGSGGWGTRAVRCPSEDFGAVPKNTWLEMAYHEGYLSRKKFRELKKRYEKVYALVTQGRKSVLS